MKFFITGGTGFIGSALQKKLLALGHEMTISTRSQKTSENKRVKFSQWDAKSLGPWTKALDGSDVVINLAGVSIFEKRWNPEFKEEIRASRIETTKLLVKAIGEADKKPSLFVSASAVGFYGDQGDTLVDEDSKAGKDFLADICLEWENASKPASDLGVRVVNPRIGVVLGKNGGALEKIIPPFKAFVGGPLGKGDQWFPWVHLDDAVNALIYPASHSEIGGPVNIVAPEKVTMKQFAKTLGHVLKRPSAFSVPTSLLKLTLGESSDALLASQKVSPSKLLASHFHFEFPNLEQALLAII